MPNIGKWFAANTAQGVYQALVAVVVIGGGTALLTWLRGLPLHWAILLGVVTALGLALAADIVSRLTLRHRATANPPQTAPSQCRDTWLHNIANSQAKAIDLEVHLDKSHIYTADLMREHPYIEFRFSLSNRSLYDLSFDDLAGSTYFAGHLFATAPELVRPENDGLGFRQIDIIVRQRLSREDVAVILNSVGGFDFNDLSMRLQSPNFPAVVSKRKRLSPNQDVLNKELLDAYPKLGVTVKTATYSWLYDQASGHHACPLIATLELAFTNRRQRAIALDVFKLKVEFGDNTCVAFAKNDQHVFTKQFIDKQGVRHNMGRDLSNINVTPPILALQDKRLEGGLQFEYDDFDANKFPDGIDGATYTLYMVDRYGEEHPVSGFLRYEQ